MAREISNEAARPLYRQVVRAAYIGLTVNFVLGIVKALAGIATGSFALISDAVNSLGDVLTTVAVLAAIYFAQKPPDDEHPYGHTRAEAIAGVNVALVVFLSAIWVGYEALVRLPEQHEIPPSWTLWIAGINVLIKEALYRYKLSVAKKTSSSAIMAHAWDHRADAFSALAALIGLGVVRLGGGSFIWADEVAALVIVAAIVHSAYRLFCKSASELMDAQADDEFVAQVRKCSLAVPGVLGVETLWVRKSGLEYFVDIHLEVDPEMTVREGHEVSHQLREVLLSTFPSLRDVLVHIEPFEGEASDYTSNASPSN
ncbi:MAG: cation transporter [Bdellovibrionales bacterium]|nr:cation transporter [Bdellovibrionales bacterium]